MVTYLEIARQRGGAADDEWVYIRGVLLVAEIFAPELEAELSSVVGEEKGDESFAPSSTGSLQADS